MNLLKELNRRNVIRMAGLCLGKRQTYLGRKLRPAVG